MVVQSCTIAISGESLGGETIKGNGNIVTRNCDVNAFEDFSLLLPATVNFTVSDDYSCTFRVDENLLEYLDIKVKEKELIMERQQKHKNVNLCPTEFVIDITAPSLNEAGLAGSGNIYMMSPLNGDKMEFFVAGSGDITANVSNKLTYSIIGSGDIAYYGNPVLEGDKVGGRVKALESPVR